MTTDIRPLLNYRVRVAHHEFRIRARDGWAGVQMNMYVKDKTGSWKAQLED